MSVVGPRACGQYTLRNLKATETRATPPDGAVERVRALKAPLRFAKYLGAMTRAIEVFNRYERKFLVDECTARRIQEQLAEFMEPDAHSGERGFYTISSLYYDTADSLLIRRSLARPVYKEKLRLRAYGVPGPHDRVFLELKKKFRGWVNKRRTALRLCQACDFIASGRKPEIRGSMNRQVIDEIEYFLQVHDVEPRLYVAYDRGRTSTARPPASGLPSTRTSGPGRHDLGLELGDEGEPLLEPGRQVMEIKTPRSFPLWLTWILSENRAYGSSFSKYGKEYLNMLANQRQGVQEALHA